MDAVRLVRSGRSIREVARYLGYHHTAVMRWMKKVHPDERQKKTIPTLSSRPFHHPLSLDRETVQAILEYRKKYKRCAEVIHHFLEKDGMSVSLSSVKRTLKRNGLVYPSKWKKWHQYPERPKPESPGMLVELDTVHDGPNDEKRLYLYTLLDVCSRWAYAEPTEHINTHNSLEFVKEAQIISPFKFQTLQSDHGSEFSKWFTKRIMERDMAHRHSRVRTPNDNAHLERFNRTIQEECIFRIPRNMRSWTKEIPEYLRYYNNERPHMGLDMKSPMDIIDQVVPSY